MYTMEGKIEIDLVEFWEFVMKYSPTKDEVRFGVPRFNQSNGTVEIDFAASSEGDPFDWAVAPIIKKQWEEYYKAIDTEEP